MIEAGNVWLPERANAPWVDDFIEECAAFPTGAYADHLLRLARNSQPHSFVRGVGFTHILRAAGPPS
jgi:hypothetical protein